MASDSRYKRLPGVVHTILIEEKAWLVGSGAHWYIDGADPEEEPADYDLVVPTENYPSAILRMSDAGGEEAINSMGGTEFRFESGLEVDLWPQTIHEYVEISTSQGFSPIALVRLNPKVELKERL